MKSLVSPIATALMLVFAGLVFYLLRSSDSEEKPSPVLEFRITNTRDQAVEFFSMPDVEGFSPRATYRHVTCGCIDKCRPATIHLEPEKTWVFRWVLNEACEVVVPGIFVPSVELLNDMGRLEGEKVEYRN